jgi:hypothetical protein
MTIRELITINFTDDELVASALKIYNSILNYYKPREINCKYGLKIEDIYMPKINKNILIIMK